MNHIKEFWSNNATKYKKSHWVSWGDKNLIDLEVQVISDSIVDGDDVLDVGCSNGHATLRHIDRVNSIVGIDYSEQMIENALVNKEELDRCDKSTFKVGNAVDIEFDDESFDVVYTTRVLINLPTWNDQIQGIRECIRVCRKGGTIVISEAFWEPLMALNAIRALSGLKPLAEHDFNRYLKKEKLEKFLGDMGLNYRVENFSAVYYLGSRFVRDLVTNIDDYEGYSNPINDIFYNIEKGFSGGNFGIQQAYVMEKK